MSNPDGCSNCISNNYDDVISHCENCSSYYSINGFNKINSSLSSSKISDFLYFIRANDDLIIYIDELNSESSCLYYETTNNIFDEDDCKEYYEGPHDLLLEFLIKIRENANNINVYAHHYDIDSYYRKLVIPNPFVNPISLEEHVSCNKRKLLYELKSLDLSHSLYQNAAITSELIGLMQKKNK